VKLYWHPRAWEDYQRWRKTNAKVFKIINALITSIQLTPYEGLGRPKALQRELEGWWSRQITQDHRLVYRIQEKGGKERLEIAQCRYHYND
jgi:toxin YoeB